MRTETTVRAQSLAACSDGYDRMERRISSALGEETEVMFSDRVTGRVSSRLLRFRSVDGWAVRIVENDQEQTCTFTDDRSWDARSITPAEYFTAALTGQRPS